MPNLAPIPLNARERAAAAAAVPYIKQFNYQSYFDSTLLERALVSQTPGVPGIVASTETPESDDGVGFILASASQTPVAVAPDGGSTVILRPGQAFYPGYRFRGFTWGLPYGWLGGGIAYLLVVREDGTEVRQDTTPEVIFHRARYKTYARADNVAIGTNYNWPNRFPWLAAGGVSQALYQGLPAAFSVEPTRISMRLRLSTLAVSATMRMNFNYTDDFECDQSVGSPPTIADYDALGTSGSFIEVVWPIFAASGFQISGVAPAQFPLLTLDASSMRIGGDFALLTLVSMDDNIPSGSFVDIVRYGRL